MSFLSSLSVLIFQGYFCVVVYSSWPPFSFFSGVARETCSPKRQPACTVCAALAGPSGLSSLLLGTMPLFMAHAVPAVNVVRSCTAHFSVSAAGGYCPAFYCFYHVCVAMAGNELPPLLFGCVTASILFFKAFSNIIFSQYFLLVFFWFLLSFTKWFPPVKKHLLLTAIAGLPTHHVPQWTPSPKKVYLMQRWILRKTMACLHFPYLS